jgi:polyphosphate kinase 2 (PPK2 family)
MSKMSNGDWPPTERILDLAKMPNLKPLSLKQYEKQLDELQYELVALQQQLIRRGRRVIVVFQGMDAAGKGGAIKRLTRYMDPRHIEVHAIGAPNEQERGHNWLRRFWLRLPSNGRIAIFDRSWYERMLVEPVEELCTHAEYARAAREIRQFERFLTDNGSLLAKFWLQIDKETQLARFREREDNPLKRWKISDDDWRNRENFDRYQKFAQKMFKKTDAPHAPWLLVNGNDKLRARVSILSHMRDLLRQV